MSSQTPRQLLPPEALEGDLVRPEDPRFGLIWINPERVSGAQCFYGTRVPNQTLFDYLEAGDPLDDFLDGFPGVTREQAIAVLELARKGVCVRGRAARSSCWIIASLAAGTPPADS